jgi:hypothetical protein
MRACAVATSCLILLTACTTPGDQQPAAGSGAQITAESTAGSLSVANFAGTWENTTRLQGVEEAIPATMTGSASGDDWTMSLPGRDNIPLEVSIVGDSLIGQSAEYESILRPGVVTTVRTASVLHGDMLMGNLVATYRTPQGEERVLGTIEGRRAQ